MNKINLLQVEQDDLVSYEKDCFKEIKLDTVFYGILLNSGFDDDKIKANIGTVHTYYVDFYNWKKIKTYADCIATGEKFDYKLYHDGKSVIRERGILKPYQDYLDYKSRFIIKDFSDDFNNVLFKDVDNKSVKSQSSIEVKNNNWIYLTGALRSGRTYCAIAIINSSVKNGNDHLAFLDSAKEIKILSDLFFNSRNEFENKMNLIKNSHLLVFDGFGNEYVNDIVRDSIIIPILQYRAMNNLMTVFTSDFSLEDLITLYSKKDKEGNNIRVKQLANILHAKIRTEIVTSKTSLY